MMTKLLVNFKTMQLIDQPVLLIQDFVITCVDICPFILSLNYL